MCYALGVIWARHESERVREGERERGREGTKGERERRERENEGRENEGRENEGREREREKIPSTEGKRGFDLSFFVLSFSLVSEEEEEEEGCILLAPLLTVSIFPNKRASLSSVLVAVVSTEGRSAIRDEKSNTLPPPPTPSPIPPEVFGWILSSYILASVPQVRNTIHIDKNI